MRLSKWEAARDATEKANTRRCIGFEFEVEAIMRSLHPDVVVGVALPEGGEYEGLARFSLR